MNTHTDAARARDDIARYTERPYTNPHPYRPDDVYDLSAEILRDLLIENADADAIDIAYYTKTHPTIQEPVIRQIARTLADAVLALYADKYSRHYLSELMLSYSLCPMHASDYQGCFDDDDDECRLIREYFPNHDT